MDGADESGMGGQLVEQANGNGTTEFNPTVAAPVEAHDATYHDLAICGYCPRICGHSW